MSQWNFRRNFTSFDLRLVKCASHLLLVFKGKSESAREAPLAFALLSFPSNSLTPLSHFLFLFLPQPIFVLCFLWNGGRGHFWQACGASSWWPVGCSGPVAVWEAALQEGWTSGNGPKLTATTSLQPFRDTFKRVPSFICQYLYSSWSESFHSAKGLMCVFFNFLFFWFLLLTAKDLLSLLENHPCVLHLALPACWLVFHRLHHFRVIFIPRRVCSKLPGRHRSEVVENPR